MKDTDTEIIDVEIVDEGGSAGSGRGPRSSYYQAGNGNSRMTYFSMAQINSPGHQGLMQASTVTLILFIACLVKWGFLAALGFIFFYAVGSALGIAFNLRQVLRGRLPNPWLWRVGNWCMSMGLVACLV